MDVRVSYTRTTKIQFIEFPKSGWYFVPSEWLAARQTIQITRFSCETFHYDF